MEPAGERRDGTMPRMALPVFTSWPQWSPPLIGGTLLQDWVTPLDTWLPQWSPPVIGGTTQGHPQPACASLGCRNGARR